MGRVLRLTAVFVICTGFTDFAIVVAVWLLCAAFEEV